MLLTQSTTPIIGWIATLLGYVMEFIFYCLNFIGIQNIGLCIIIFTIIVRLLMLPLTIKQQKFAKISQVMQPEINKIQRKYRNKTDQASMMKQNEEIIQILNVMEAHRSLMELENIRSKATTEEKIVPETETTTNTGSMTITF